MPDYPKKVAETPSLSHPRSMRPAVSELAARTSQGSMGGLFQALEIGAEIFQFPEHISSSAWLEHVPFAFWLSKILRPRTFVELGTHTGLSYFAFCHAIKALSLSTRAYAVDSWQGDAHAGQYDESVFAEVARENDRKYSGFSSLMKM